MKTTKKSDKNATKTTKIAYPKANVTVLEQATKEVTNSLQGTINSSYSQTNLYQENERLKQQIDEIKTNQLSSQNSTSGASVDLSPLENAISQNASDIDALQSSVNSNTSAISSLQSAKQDKLTAGNNISISNGVISATDTTYTAGQNISINANNVINAIDTKYFAGTNVTIDQNNVISATCTTAGEQDLQEINQQLAELRKQVGILNGTYDENRLSGEFVPYADDEIVQTYDCYERELNIFGTGTNEILSPNILFVTETQVTENSQTTQAKAKIIVNFQFIPSSYSGGLTFNIYDNGDCIGTFTQYYNITDLNSTQIFESTINNYTCTTKNHNLYVVCTASNSNTNNLLTYMKIEITAPNVVILNKIQPFDVEYNFYTDTYYLSDCRSGTAKVCEISASDLSYTSDIVWQDTGIEAQNYKVFFTATNKSNSKLVATTKNVIITHKNNTIEIVGNQGQSYIMPVGTTKVASFSQISETPKFYVQSIIKNQILTYQMTLNNFSTYTTESVQYGDQIADFETLEQHWDYCTTTYNKAIMCRTQIDGNNQFALSYMTTGQTFSSGYKNSVNTKGYMTDYVGTYEYYANQYFKYYGKWIALPIKMRFSIYYFTPYYVGEYDDFFLGANNDYFCVYDKKLHYFKY